MAIIKGREMKAMGIADMKKKLAELKMEMIKSARPTQGTSSKGREIKRTIARMLTYIKLKETKK